MFFDFALLVNEQRHEKHRLATALPGGRSNISSVRSAFERLRSPSCSIVFGMNAATVGMGNVIGK